MQGKQDPSLDTNVALRPSLWSQLRWGWLGPLLKRSRTQGTLNPDDLDVLPAELDAASLTDELEGNWLDETKNPLAPASLLRATVRTVRRRCLLLSLLLIPHGLISIGQPLMIIFLMNFFEPCTTMHDWQAWTLLAASILIVWIPCFFYHHQGAKVRCLGVQMRTAYSHLIYRKMLRLSNESMNSVGTGGINNLLSTDASRIEVLLTFVHYLWVAPLQVLLIIGFFWYFVNYISLIVLGYTIFVMSAQFLLSGVLVKLQGRVLRTMDERVKLMAELIKSMRIVKVYCWEPAFVEKVLAIRHREFFRYAFCSVFTSLTQTLNHTFVSMTFFLVYLTIWSTDVVIDSRFFALCACLIGFLQYMIIDSPLPGVRALMEFLAAVKRVQAFLLLDECKRDERLLSQPNLPVKHVKSYDPTRPLKIVCDLKSARWEEKTAFALKNIVFEAQPGELICVVGPVGAGKTSLLHAISGEIAHFDGKMRMYGSCCYLPQESWIFSSTIKENILFGEEYDHLRFRRVVHAAALETDLDQFLHRELTVVGDHGVMLSGGQRARVNLARALYRNADIYLLDDPLSAVDAKVSKHLFNKSIKGYLRHKICVLVTHQKQFLQHATKIIELDKGEIVRMGTFGELLAASSSYCSLLEDAQEAEAHANDHPNTRASFADISLSEEDDEDSTIPSVISEEIKREGNVDWRVYLEYAKAGARFVLGLFVLLFVFCGREALFVFHTWWLAKWTDDETYRNQFNMNCTNTTDEHIMAIRAMSDTEWTEHRNRKFYVYAVLIASLFVATLVRRFAMQAVCLNAARVLHNRMFQRVIRCPIGMFDANPVGRILNRFTKDVANMDGILPDVIYELFHYSFYVLGTVVLVATVNPWALIAAGVAVTAMVFIRARFASCLRDLRRLEGVTRSPIHSHLTASIYGIKVIRSYRAEQMSFDMFRNHMKINNRANYLIAILGRWAGLRFDWIACTFFTLITLPAMVVRVVNKDISAADMALTFSYGLNLVSLFQWTIRLSVDCATQMTSVERVLDYCSLEQEPPAEVPVDQRPPSEWPARGEIVFDDVSLEPSLRNIRATINAGEKVGIVGRTGAGKTSLVETLFRLRSPIDGQIRIDGIDIHSVGLTDVRRRISIIPQDPVLITGTMRSNLDRMDEYSDEEIWHALEEVKLKKLVAEVMPAGLQSDVNENGSNLSVGQKQLVCLARAILKKSQILVMDEATANVDQLTDELIQQTIRDKFRQCTVLTVAHRLRTVIDCNRIMVLESGQLAEFDAPHRLLSDPTSHLSALVAQLGDTEANCLRQMAAPVARL